MGSEHEQNCCLFVQKTTTSSADHGSSSTSIHPADAYLAQHGRKRKFILGDGNCLFRAVSWVVNGTQDNHPMIRKNLVSFVQANRQVFEKFVMKGTFESHVSTMRREGAWGTQVELCAAASFFQVQFYLCSPHPTTHKYRWLVFESLDRTRLHSQVNSDLAKHVELCHTGGDHFDCVVNKDNLIPTSPPQLDDISSSQQQTVVL